MTIKTVTTFSKSLYIPEDLLDSRIGPGLPPTVAAKLLAWMEEGKLPSTRQPEDSMVVTDENVIVTMVWLDRDAAQEWVNLGHNNPNIPEIISRVLVED